MTSHHDRLKQYLTDPEFAEFRVSREWAQGLVDGHAEVQRLWSASDDHVRALALESAKDRATLDAIAKLLPPSDGELVERVKTLVLEARVWWDRSRRYRHNPESVLTTTSLTLCRDCGHEHTSHGSKSGILRGCLIGGCKCRHSFEGLSIGPRPPKIDLSDRRPLPPERLIADRDYSSPPSGRLIKSQPISLNVLLSPTPSRYSSQPQAVEPCCPCPGCMRCCCVRVPGLDPDYCINVEEVGICDCVIGNQGEDRP